MTTKVVFMNLYAQGHYHRRGKPGTLPFHPGDLYATLEAATADIDWQAPYLGTIHAEVPDHIAFGSDFQPYGKDSKPAPLRDTRVPSQIVGMRPLTVREQIESEPVRPIIRPADVGEFV